jgi:hypothetical protein
MKLALRELDKLLIFTAARARAKVLFEALIKEGYDKEIWRYRLAPLYDIMHAHWLKEEETMIPFGPDYFSKTEWEDFGKKFNEIVEDYLRKHGSLTSIGGFIDKY